MKCKDCGRRLLPTEFYFEKRTPAGGLFSLKVDGVECPGCSLRALTGPEAEMVSEAWMLVISGSSNRGTLPSTTAKTPEFVPTARNRALTPSPILAGRYDAKTVVPA